jgi:phosphoglucosamine mutase
MSTERRLFGTDGIRGRANEPPMTPEVALRVGMAVAAHFGRHGKVLVGKDTRRSGYLFETAISAGLCALGVDVLLVGPLPTPGIAYLTQSMRADAGVVISASHNPFEDNGLKIFASDGFKLADEVERHLEELMESPDLDALRAHGADVGRVTRIDGAGGRYLTHVKQVLPRGMKLDGMRIVVDCAHGAAYRVAPEVLAELGAEVIPLGNRPDGSNINAGCGALYPETMQQRVRETGAQLGIALDGDADRVVIADERGDLVDGDAVLAMCARDMQLQGELHGATVVATVMSNLGLERSLAEVGIAVERTAVGDRYVVETMRRGGFNLGGEQSGHVVFMDHATTGDGIVAALRVLAIMLRSGTPLSRLRAVMQPVPQLLRSVTVGRRAPLEACVKLGRTIRQVEQELGRDGRVLVRFSGTEAKLRVMVEALDGGGLEALVDRLVDAACDDLGRAP